MKKLLTYILIIFTIHLSGQTNITGTWYSPKDVAGVSYVFDSSGTFKFNSFTCLSEFHREGNYTINEDSIKIRYNPLTAEEKQVYRIKTDPKPVDTLYIINSHQIKVNKYISIYDRILGKTFSLTDNIFTPGQNYRTHSVLFDLDKFTIRPESFPFLDSVAYFLTANKGLTIAIQRHEKTDPKRSMNLTQRRAESVRDYLVSKGINKARLTAVGYGDQQPVYLDSEIKKAKTKEEKRKTDPSEQADRVYDIENRLPGQVNVFLTIAGVITCNSYKEHIILFVGEITPTKA